MKNKIYRTDEPKNVSNKTRIIKATMSMTTMTTTLRNITVTVAAIALFSACETTPPQPPQLTTVSCNVPVITPLPETKETQSKGGLEISIAPFAYSVSRKMEVTNTPTEPEPVWERPDLERIQRETGRAMMVVVRTETPSLVVSPGHLSFTVKINNKMSRVFRGAGTVVQFNAGGKLLAVDQSGYGEMLNAIVPPRSELQLAVHGPKISELPVQGTLGLFFYDVVTDIDAAGNVKEKQNYEWYFNYTTRVVEESGEVKSSRLKVTQ